MLSIGLVQLTSTEDTVENLRQVAHWVGRAAGEGAELVALPEGFFYLGDEAGKLRVAEPLSGPTIARLGQLAREYGIWLMAGGFPEKSESVERVYMSAVLFDSQGEISAVYRKMHLFDVALGEGGSFKESRTVTPGDKIVVAATPWGKIGLSICYDLRFPELYRKLTERGAELIFVPSAFNVHTGKDHWQVLLQARAIENLAYVAAPAQFGEHGAGRRSYGKSLLVDPWGRVVAEAPDSPGVIVGQVDFNYLETVRRQIPCLQNRRLR